MSHLMSVLKNLLKSLNHIMRLSDVKFKKTFHVFMLEMKDQ